MLTQEQNNSLVDILFDKVQKVCYYYMDCAYCPFRESDLSCDQDEWLIANQVFIEEEYQKIC